MTKRGHHEQTALPAAFAVGAVAVGAGRRLARRSGVSEAEVRAALPSDLITCPVVEFNRGITFDRSVAVVWPWLALRRRPGAVRVSTT
jgi:hypothetical protein